MEEEDAYSEVQSKTKVNLRDFDDVDPNGFMDMKVDDFDDIDDLEKQIDFDAPLETDDKFKNELLFYVQGLGSTKKHNELEFYMKGPHCEDSLKDIIRMCKRDDDDFPGTKIELGKWEVLQKDLLQLLVSQHQDKKLTFYLLILLVQLTEYPRKSVARRNELLGYLQSYKLAFSVNNNVIQTINMHLADCFSIAESERTKTCEQMIELIVTLYKNLLKVPDYTAPDGSVNQKTGLQPKLITALHKQDTLDAFIFMVQQSSETLMKRLNLNLLEIFYSIFSSFEPQWLFQRTDQDKGLIQTIREREQRERMKRLSEMSTRHARFDCNVKVVRNFGRGAKIIHNPFKSNNDKTDVPNALKKPKSRKVDERNASIFPNNHNKDVIISNIVEEAELRSSLKYIIRDYAVDFVEHAYDKLIESLYEEIYKNTTRVEENDKIYYFVIMAFGLEVFRLNFYFKKQDKSSSSGSDEYNIASVGAALQLTVFELIQSTIMKEVTTVKKKSFSVRMFHASFHAFLQLLYCIKEMRISMSETARKSANILMQKIFTQDNAKMLRLGFNFYQPDVHDPKLGRTLTEFVGTFLDLLDDFAKGKVLKIQTSRKIMRKNLKEKRKAERAKMKRQEKREREKAKKQKKAKEAKAKKEKEKEKKRKEKERAKLERAKPKKHKVKKEKAKKHKKEEDQEEFIEEVEYREENENENVYKEHAKLITENEEVEYVDKEDRESAEKDEGSPRETLENQPEPIGETINPTVGTEYTVGSQESNFMQTLENPGSTLETEATMPQTLDNATLEEEFQEPAPRVNRRTNPSVEVDNTLATEDGGDEYETENNENKENQEHEENFDEEEVNREVKSQSSRGKRIIKRKRTEEEEEEAEPIIEYEEEGEGEIITEKPKEAEEEEEEEAVDTDGEDDEKNDDSDEAENKDDDEDEVKKSEEDEEEEKEDMEEEEEEDEDDDDEEDSDDGFDDEGPAFQSRIVNFASELAFLADYRVVDILLNMIRADKLESNDIKVNNAVAGFMKKIITVLKADWLFFQIDYLLIFQDILNLKNPRVRVENQQLFDVITAIVRNFFALLKKNKMLSVECLFRFANRLVKDGIVNNYQDEVARDPVDEDDDIPVDNFEFEGTSRRRGNLSVWDEKSDMILIQNYDDYKDFDDCADQLFHMFIKMHMSQFSPKDIKNRIKVLKLEKGKEKALEMFDLIYKDATRLNFEQALNQAFQLIDNTKFTKEDLIEFLVRILEEYISFKGNFVESSESSMHADMAIVPLQKKDFDILEKQEYMDPLFMAMNLREPRQGERYWRVPGFLAISEVQILIDKLNAPVEI